MVNPEFIYIVGYLPDGVKYAVGRAGERARQVVQYKYQAQAVNGRRIHGHYTGVPGRKPVIPAAARKVSRRAAGAALCKAFGMERW